MLFTVASNRGDIGTEASNGDLFLETAGTLLAIMCLRQNGRSVLFLLSLFVGRWWFLLVLVNCCCVSSFLVISCLMKEWVTYLVLVVSELVVGIVIGGSCLEFVIINNPRNDVVVAKQVPLLQPFGWQLEGKTQQQHPTTSHNPLLHAHGCCREALW